MASPPILDFNALVAPIPGADPKGTPLEYTVRKKLDDARKEINPADFAANDPRRPEQFQAANWHGIEQLACETLATSSKDLVAAARLTESLVKQHGFRGLRDGLRLLRRLTAECWDRLHPVPRPPEPSPDDDGLTPPPSKEQLARDLAEMRAAAFNWLDDDLMGAKFPNALRMIPLTNVGEEQKYGWQQWKDAQEAKGAVSGDAFDRAVAGTPRTYCQATVDDIAESVVELDQLAKVLLEKMGKSVAPSMSQVRKALLECQGLAKRILERKGPAPLPPPPPQNNGDDAKPTPENLPAAVQSRALTREDVLSRLADASTLLLQMEPHSPIAFMIQRAVKLARLPFPELMKVLVRDQNVLGQLDRDLDLGLASHDAAAKQDAAKPPVKK
jgi:type VI secretion system protein ImpA